MPWSSDEAYRILLAWKNCIYIRPKKLGLEHLDKTYRFAFKNASVSWHIAVVRARKAGAVTAYVNARSISGKLFPEGMIPGVRILQKYLRGHEGTKGNPGISASVAKLASLDPRLNDVLRLDIDGPSAFKAVVDWYADLDQSPSVDFSLPELPDASVKSKRIPISPEEDERRRKKQAENGALGEILAMRYEIARLGKLHCANAEALVEHISKRDTGAGYDLESNWNGERRCIEVKASDSRSNSFFISANEVKTLRELKGSGWIYLIDLSRQDDPQECVRTIPNAGEKLGPAELAPEGVLIPTQFKATLREIAH